MSTKPADKPPHQTPDNNGYPSSSTSPHSSSTTPATANAQYPKPVVHRINASQFGFTPMRQPSAPSPLSRTAALGSAPDYSNGADGLPQKAVKKVHIAQPETDDDDAPPCFIHSGLDKHGSLQDWLRGKADSYLPHPHRKAPLRDARGRKNSEELRQGRTTLSPVQKTTALSPESDQITPRPLPGQQPSMRDMRDKRDKRRGDGYESDKSTSVDSRLESPPDNEYEYDDEYEDGPTSNLTRQLAATAQGVREVSKELGRTTVHSRIQHILIVTKARDNGLIRLTRELALYLMQRELPFIPNSAATSMTDLSRMSERSERSGFASQRRVVVYVDAQLRNSKRFDAEGLERDYPHLFEPIPRRRSSSTSASSVSLSSMASSWGPNGWAQDRRREDGQLRYWTADMCSNSPQLFDFVVTLGGDGTVLFTSWLFQKIVPPVLPFALGSLGFLTNFNFKDHRKIMDRVIDEGIRVNLRMRFTATVYRAVAPDESMVVKRHGKRKAIRRPGGDILVRQVDKDGWDSLEGGMDIPKHTSGKDKEILCFSTRPVEQFEVLNDLVVDRGPSPFVSLLEVFGDDHHLTTVQADGLTVSTPTGSTAYSLSAGGSLVHPQIPALLLTPICPHTLSFRPMLLPDSMELRICVPYNSRSTAWASFDGRGRIELKQGDHIKITASKYPFPTVCADKQSTDWFSSISRTLRWNERERQKSFVVVEEAAEPAKGGKHRAHDDVEYDEDDDEEEGTDSDGSYFTDEEDDFDIDDRSVGDAPSPVPIQPPRIRTLTADNLKSGVQSPDRFGSGSGCRVPPPISQRHLLEKLASVEKNLRQASINGASDTEGVPDREPYLSIDDRLEAEEAHDDVSSLPDADTPGFARCESDATLGGNEYLLDANYDPSSVTSTRHSRSDSITIGSRTPRQGRSRSRSRHRGASGTGTRSRSGSPAVGASKPKAFAFFGQDDSTSELSDHSF